MSSHMKFKSDAFEAIHLAASGLENANAISKKAMREYDILCIAKAPAYNPAAIARIRHQNNLSQPPFATYLNVSKSTLEKWESGDKHPTGAALVIYCRKTWLKNAWLNKPKAIRTDNENILTALCFVLFYG